MLKITDTITGATATVATDDLAATLLAWNAAAPAEITEAIADLEDAVRTASGEEDALATYLAVTVERV